MDDAMGTEIKNLISKHVDDSNKFRTETRETLAKIDVHLEYNKKEVKELKKDIEDNEKDITKIKADNNNLKGAIAVMTVIGGAALAYITNLFK